MERHCKSIVSLQLHGKTHLHVGIIDRKISLKYMDATVRRVKACRYHACDQIHHASVTEWDYHALKSVAVLTALMIKLQLTRIVCQILNRYKLIKLKIKWRSRMVLWIWLRSWQSWSMLSWANSASWLQTWVSSIKFSLERPNKLKKE